MTDLGDRYQTFRRLREELAEHTYMTVAEVAEVVGMSEAWVRDLPDALLPAVDTTPDSERKTRRFRPDDVRSLGARLRAYELAKKEGRGEAFLEELAEQWEERDREEMESVLEGVA